MKKKILSLLLAFILFVGMLPVTGIASYAENSEASDVSDVLKGKYISVMGDSISTYSGWSDKYPITDEGTINRYGEPYYGPVGGDFHNTELLVTDTWWHQAAQQLGGEILVSNAGNSSGLLHASYPANADWQQYLQDMLAYKTRPYHLGAQGISPHIIALYIGSNDVAKVAVSGFGSIDDVDFDKLITENEDGTFTYNTPETVAESYCILLHKIKTTYPNAEVYCFTVVPSAGGYLSTGNTRAAKAVPFNKMVKGVAEYFDAIVVDLYEGFGLDPNCDGVLTQEDWDAFKTNFNNDPHPNAAGFDVITQCFVKAVLENSRYAAKVESKAGVVENIAVNASANKNSVYRQVTDRLTEQGMLVDYSSQYTKKDNTEAYFTEKYTSEDSTKTYIAEGGSETSEWLSAPSLSIEVPLKGGTENSVSGGLPGEPVSNGDVKSSEDDGIYDYTLTQVIPGAVSVNTISVYATEPAAILGTDERHYLRSDTFGSDTNDMIIYPAISRPQSKEEVPEIKPGYEFIYIGSDQLSHFYASYLRNAPDAGVYPDEAPVYTDENRTLYAGYNHDVLIKRGLAVPNLFLKDMTVEGSFPTKYESIQQFTLSDREGRLLTAYCADQVTAAIDGYNYRMKNLEDAKYYTNSAAEMIRAIAINGYWGAASGQGSLAALKAHLASSGEFTEAEINALTDGMAMTATQYAIWSYSNAMHGFTYVNAYWSKTGGSPNSAADQDDVAIIMKLYHYLAELDPISVSGLNATTSNTIINSDNFLDSVSIKLTGRADAEENEDSDLNNDIYTADISFTFVARPVENNGDELVLEITDETGDTSVLVRIAGEAQDGEFLPTVENGVYTVSDIVLQEGTENLVFYMKGTQNLANIPFLFTSEVIDGESSQTLVGIVEGKRDVGVSFALEFELDVSDRRTIMSKFWRTEKIVTQPSDDEEETTTTTGESKPSDDIAGGEVRPSDHPQTGDDSPVLLCFVLMTISVVGMIAVVVFGRKKYFIK